MEYNQTLFGSKRTICHYANGVYTRMYEIASQNISVQQGFDSGVFEKQAQLPDDLVLWEIGEESVLTRLTWHKTVNNQRVIHHSNDDKERVKLILSTNGAKVNTSTFDVTDGIGSVYDRTSQCNYRPLITANSFNTLQQYPLWNPVAGTTGGAPHFSIQPFILDFDYSGVLLCIYVATGSTTMTLKQYLDNNNNGTRISALYIEPTFGDATTHLAPTTNVRFENGSNNLYMQGMHLINSKTYDLPLDVRADLGVFLPSFIMASRPQSQFNPNNYLWVIIDIPTSLSSYRVSYYQDEEHIDGLGIIPHGENNTYNQDDIDWMLKQIALLGFWFTTDNSNLQSRVTGENCTDENTYLPEIKEGITTGNYWAGTAAAQQDAAKWNNDWREKVNYQPGGSITPTDESSRSSRLTYSSSLASFGNIWLMNSSGISILADSLKKLVTDEQNPYDPTLFYGQNPVDCIIAIKEFPIDISSCIDIIKNPEPVSLGRWNNITYVTEGIGVRLAAPLVTVKSASEPFSHITISIPAHYKDLGYPFMDYEPYSSYHLYLPFCGTVKIPSELAIESRIEVLYYADVLSGACIAHVYINYKYYCSAQGQLATEVPISGYKISDYTRDMLNATYAQKQAYASIASDVGRIISSAGGAGITLGISDKRAWGNSAPSVFPNMSAGSLTKLGGLTMGFGTAIQAGADMWSKYETIKYNKTILDHSAPAPVKSSLGGGLVNWESPYFVEMLVQRPVFMEGYNAEVFNATMGRACYLADTLDNHSGGYVEAINCKLSGFPATQTEKVELAKLLADGVFL